MTDFPQPAEEAIYYSDSDCYACLANDPKVRGHSVVVWKKEVEDISLLSHKQYLWLMDVVEEARDALKEFYETEKVYMVYMDESEHVHWHLVPRTGDKKGYELLESDVVDIDHFSDSDQLERLVNLD